jgi:cardiolipin synthase
LYEGGYFHPKTLNIDSAVVSIGTANMDIRSFNLDYETNAIIYDEGKAKEMEAQFMEDLKSCKQWTLGEYNSYSVAHRFVDSVYRLASPLL